jgi:hypothetical protein
MLFELVNEWLLCKAKSAMFQLCQGKNKLLFRELMMMSIAYQSTMLNWIVIMIAHWSNFPWEYMSLHSDTLSLFRAIQSLFFLLIVACIEEKQNNQIYCIFRLARLSLGTHDLPHSRWANYCTAVVVTVSVNMNVENRTYEWH